VQSRKRYLDEARRELCLHPERAIQVSLFLYREVLHQDLGSIDALCAKNSKRLPSAPTKNDSSVFESKASSFVYPLLPTTRKQMAPASRRGL
jgi:hypothetical protein